MNTISTIEQKLTEAFSPSELTVRDDSELHRGHAGFREGESTHLHVIIRSGHFDGMSRLARQRAVMKALAEELAGPVHALSMEVAGSAA